MVLTLLSVLREVWCSLPLLSYLLGSLGFFLVCVSDQQCRCEEETEEDD